MAKENGNKLATVESFGPLAEVRESLDGLAEAFKENLGGEITLFDLDSISWPAAGATTWQVPTLEEEPETVKELRGVIVSVQPARQYYKSREAIEGTPPDCASGDGLTGWGDRGLPSDGEQYGPHECETCPRAQWGSAVGADGDPTRGQACRQRKHLLFLREGGGVLPLFINVPPTSLKGLTKYLTRLAGAGKGYSSVVTVIGLDRVKSQGGTPYSQAVWSMGGVLSADDAAAAKLYRAALAEFVKRGAPTAPSAPPPDPDDFKAVEADGDATTPQAGTTPPGVEPPGPADKSPIDPA